ncbi:hypothetical protein OROGR_011304 [Orobanche gracilis]
MKRAKRCISETDESKGVPRSSSRKRGRGAETKAAPKKRRPDTPLPETGDAPIPESGPETEGGRCGHYATPGEENYGHEDANESGCIPLSPLINVERVEALEPFVEEEWEVNNYEDPAIVFDCYPNHLPVLSEEEISEFNARQAADETLPDGMLPSWFAPFAEVTSWNEDKRTYDKLKMCATLAVEDYNEQEGTDYQFVTIEDVDWQMVNGTKYHITYSPSKLGNLKL